MKTIKPIILLLVIFISLGCTEKPPAAAPAPTGTPEETEPPAIIPFFPTPIQTPEPGIPIKYIVWIDSDYGFYRIRAIREQTTFNLPISLNIRNLTLRTGDSVRWMNDDSYDFPLTLISNEGLWGERAAYLRWQGARFEYTFNETGTYTISIKEFRRVRNQTIVVNP